MDVRGMQNDYKWDRRRSMDIHRLAAWLRHSCICWSCITSVVSELDLTLILLSRVPSYLLLLRCNNKSTRTLPVVHALGLRAALVHWAHKDSRIS